MKRYADWVSKGFENEAGMIEHEAGMYVLHREAQERIDALTVERDDLLKEREDALRQEPIAFVDQYGSDAWSRSLSWEDPDTRWNHKAGTKLYAKPIPPAIPEGMALIPKIPTNEMIAAFKRRFKKGDFWQERFDGAIIEMIAASQKGSA